jgi:lipoate-protein ligase B
VYQDSIKHPLWFTQYLAVLTRHVKQQARHIKQFNKELISLVRMDRGGMHRGIFGILKIHSSNTLIFN